MKVYLDTKDTLCSESNKVCFPEDAIGEVPGAPYIGLELYDKIRYTDVTRTRDARLRLTVQLTPRKMQQGDEWNKLFTCMMRNWIDKVMNEPGTSKESGTMSFSEFASKLTQLSDTPDVWNEEVIRVFLKHDGRGRLMPKCFTADVDCTCGTQPSFLCKVEFTLV